MPSDDETASRDPDRLVAICGGCLGELRDVCSATLEAACEGRVARGISAADDLVFPGLSVHGLSVVCPRCGREMTGCVAVTEDVAAVLRSYRR